MSKILTFVAIASILASTVSTQCTEERALTFFKRSVYEFTVKLAGRITQETQNHFVASGLSPWSLIATMSLGATGDTLSDIFYVLRMHPHPCFNEKYNRIINRLITITNGTVLERSSAILLDTNTQVADDFIYDAKKAGVSNVIVLPFNEAEATAAYVNDFVSTATHEAIDEIVTANDVETASILMLDAMFFKGAWKLQFPYIDTEISAFYNDRGGQIGDVNLMYVNGIFNVTAMKNLQARVLELPYGEENRFSMLIFLPYPDVTINYVIENLNFVTLRSIFAQFELRQPQTVAVQIPRFKVTSDINNLKELLADMGLRKMFDYEASFDGIAAGVYVSNLVQKADVEVTEDGTVASVVSEATFEARMLPDQFVANKPFAFMIVDRDAEIPLFVGAYSLPKIY